MRLFNRELYHVFIKRKGFLLLLLFVAAEICMAFYGAKNCRDILYEAEEQKSVYQEYMNTLGGKHTAQKEAYAKDLYQEVSQASDRLNQVTDAFILGEVNSQVYYETVLETERLLEHKKVTDLLYDQLTYISQDPQHRYWMYENGWIYFWEDQGMDYILIFLILIGVLPIFTMDYEKDMHMLNQTTKSGGHLLYRCRVLAGLFFVFVCVLSQIVIKLGVAHLYFGLDGFEMPIQSIQSLFEGQSWSLTCLQAVAVLFLLRLLGGVYMAVILVAASVWRRRVLDAGVLAAAAVCIPMILLKDAYISVLPLPGTFLDAQNFFTGIWNENTGVQEFLNVATVRNLCIEVIGILLVLYVLGFFLYQAEWGTGALRRKRVQKK